MAFAGSKQCAAKVIVAVTVVIIVVMGVGGYGDGEVIVSRSLATANSSS